MTPLELVKTKPRMSAQDFLKWQNQQVELKRTVDAFQSAVTFRATDAFSNLAARTGYGSTNLLEGTQYPLTRLSRNYILMQSLYRSNWIVRKVIDAMADDMLKNWVKIVSDQDPQQIARFQKTIDDTGTQNQMLKAMQWGRLFGGAGALIVIDGDGDKLSEPLDPENVLPGTYRGLIPFDRWAGITPSADICADVKRPLDYGLPEFYNVTTERAETLHVHSSRVLRFIGRDLPNWEKQAETYWGISEVEVFFEELKKRDNTSWNLASLIFRANLVAIRQKDLNQLLSGLGSSQQALQRFMGSMQAITQLMSTQGMIILPEEGGLETHQYGFAGINDVYQSFMMDICGATEYPMSRLFGRSSSGLAGTNEGDEHSYYDLIGQKQKRELDPQMKKLMPIVAMSTWGEVPDDFSWIYNPVRSMSNEEQAELGAKRTTAVVEVFNAGITGRKTTLMELKQMSDETNMFSNITDEDIADADNEVVGKMEELEMDLEAKKETGFGGEPEDAKGDKGKPKFSKAQDRESIRRVTFQGLPIAIENMPGTERFHVNGSTVMQHPYGYIEHTEGTDGDDVDCFLGDNNRATHAYVVHTQNPETKKYDEDKVMLGFSTAREARAAFAANYDSPNHFESMEKIPMHELPERLMRFHGRQLAKDAVTTKFTHEDVNYTPQAKNEKTSCGNCHYFTGNGCKIVEDPVRAPGWCEEFERK